MRFFKRREPGAFVSRAVAQKIMEVAGIRLDAMDRCMDCGWKRTLISASPDIDHNPTCPGVLRKRAVHNLLLEALHYE